MGIFSSFKSKDKNADNADATEKSSSVQREIRKAKPWFQRAQDVSATNHDYAIECFINGFKHEPDSMNMHEALRDVSLKRKVAGGKPAGFMEQMKSGGSDPVDKMIHAERMLALDPVNAKLARDVMKYAIAADEVNDDLSMGEVAHWVGQLAMDLNSQSKKPDKGMFIEISDLFQKVPDFALAVAALRRAVNLTPEDTDLLSRLKNLEAEEYARRQQGDSDKVEAGDFRKNIKDADAQSATQQDDAVTKTERMINESIARRRAEFEEDPADVDRGVKLVEALLKKPEKEAED